MFNDLKRKSDQIDPENHVEQEDNDAILNEENASSTRNGSNSTNSNDSDYINKIKAIISSNFDQEISYKQFELEKIDERIYEVQNMLDKLRVCIICNYYSLNGRLNIDEYVNHPEICKLKCEHLDSVISDVVTQRFSDDPSTSNQLIGKLDKDSSNDFNRNISNEQERENDVNDLSDSGDSEQFVLKEDLSQNDYLNQFNKQFNLKICVGNVSKYLNSKQLIANNNPSSSLLHQKTNQALMMNDDESIKSSIESSQYNQDLITHKWMIYIRSPNCAKLENYIKKVVFYLHFSYKPYDIVEVKTPPFQLIRRGWGEFPIRVQIHFKDPRNKRLDINHHLKLDWTQTGLQTFGGESFKDIDLVIKPNDFKPDSRMSISQPNAKSRTNPNEFITNKTIEPKTIIPCSNQDLNLKYSSISSDPFEKHKDSQNNQKESLLPAVFTAEDPPSLPSTLLETNNFIDNKNTIGNQIRLEMSPSSFISTDIDNSASNCISSTNFASSACFDELIHNFCSSDYNDNKTQQTVNSEDTQSSTSSTTINNIEQNIIQNQESQPITKSLGQQQSSSSIDELLNLRPKSIISNAQTISNTLNSNITSFNPKLSISKVVKSFKSSPISMATVQQNKLLNISSASSQKNETETKNSMKQIIIPKLVTLQNSQINLLSSNNCTINKSIPIIGQFDSVKKALTPILPASAASNSKLNSLTLNNNQGNMVIYKVEPSDIKDMNEKSPSILNLALSNDSGNIFENNTSISINPITNKSYTLNKNNLIESNSQSIINHDETQQDSDSERINISEISNLTNNDRLAQEKQNKVSITDTNFESHLNEKNLVIKNQELFLNEFENTLKEKINSIHFPQNSDVLANDIYSIECFIKQIQKSMNKTMSLNFESFLKIALKTSPIIAPSNLKSTDRFKSKSIDKLEPFCASSIHEFYSWTYAKRRANEWMRALHVKRKCEKLINLANRFNTSSSNQLIATWSTKSIMLWLRSHGYTPLEYQHMLLKEEDETYSKTSTPPLSNYVDSLTPVNSLLTQEKYSTIFRKFDCYINENESDDGNVIDVVGDNNPVQNTKLSLKEKIDTKLAEYLVDDNNKNSIELCEGSQYVKEQLDLLNLKAKKVNLVYNNDVPDETNTFSCNLVEKFIFVACKRFADEMIRQACADIYFDQTKTSANLPDAKNKQEINNSKKQKVEYSSKKNNEIQINNQQSVLQYQRFPQTIEVSDVYNTLLKHERFDFLTNKYMAADSIEIHSKSSLDFQPTVNLENKNKLCKNLDNNGDFIDNSNKNFVKIKGNLKRNFSESSIFYQKNFNN